MKILVALIFSVTCLTLYSQQDTTYHQFKNVYFMTPVKGKGNKQAKQIAKLLTTYFTAIEEGDYDSWYEQFSDSTIAFTAAKKFPNKFNRLKEYGIHTDTIRVISMKQLATNIENEVGIEYELIIDFGVKMNVENRVSFDHIKLLPENLNPSLFGVNLILTVKGYEICLHKYFADGDNKNK